MNTVIKKIENFFKTNYRNWKFWIIIILLVCAFSRFYKLDSIKEYVFDEVYHAFTAKMYALNRYEAWVWWTSPPEGVAYEWTHPPLAKVIMSWGIMMFGGPGAMPNKELDPNTLLSNWSFGWRFFSALFGVLCTFALFLFTKSVFKNPWVGVLTAFLFTFDLLPLVQSRTAMNDIFAVTFMLFTFYFFTKRKDQQDGIHFSTQLLNYRLPIYNWILTALFLGAAIASKWTALFTIGLLGFYQICTIIYDFFTRKSKISEKILLFSKQVVLAFSCIFVIPFIVYLVSYWQLFSVNIDDFKGNGLDESLVNMQSRQTYLESVRDDKTSTGDKTKEVVESRKKDLVELSYLAREIKVFEFFKPHNEYLTERFFIWWGLQKQMWWYHTNLKATHGYTSQWWTWPMDIRPVWFYVKYCGASDENKDQVCTDSIRLTGSERTVGDIYTMGNPFIFWMIIPIICVFGYLLSGKYRVWLYSLIPGSIILLLQTNMTLVKTTNPISFMETFGVVSQSLLPQLILFSMLLVLFIVFLELAEKAYYLSKHKKQELTSKDSEQLIPLKSALPLFLCLLIFSGYWLPWARSPRIMFFYHFFPPVTFFYPLLGYALYKVYQDIRVKKYLFWGYIAVVILSFVYFYPHVTGMQISDIHREQYFWLSSWK